MPLLSYLNLFSRFFHAATWACCLHRTRHTFVVNSYVALLHPGILQVGGMQSSLGIIVLSQDGTASQADLFAALAAVAFFKLNSALRAG